MSCVLVVRLLVLRYLLVANMLSLRVKVSGEEKLWELVMTEVVHLWCKARSSSK